MRDCSDKNGCRSKDCVLQFYIGAAKIENYSTSLIVSGLASSNFLLQVCDSKIE